MATAIEKETIVPGDMEKETTAGLGVAGVKEKVADKLLKHSHDADAAMQAFEGMDGQVIELTEAENRRLLRKIDLHLMPVRIHTHLG